MASRISVLVVDDNASVRRGLCMRLEREAGLAVAGAAGDGEEALELARRLQPDVVVLDLLLPDIDGFGVTERLRATAPRPATVLLSLYDSEVNRARAQAAGAAAFVGKQEPMEALLGAIRRAAPCPRELG
jgi:DNA-binding NarL/FixJ family response regulator